MVKKIEFWRDVQNSYGMTYRVVLKTYSARDDVSDVEALSDAILGFCAWGHVSRWNDLANGYEIRCCVDEYKRETVNEFPENWHPNKSPMAALGRVHVDHVSG